MARYEVRATWEILCNTIRKPSAGPTIRKMVDKCCNAYRANGPRVLYLSFLYEAGITLALNSGCYARLSRHVGSDGTRAREFVTHNEIHTEANYVDEIFRGETGGTPNLLSPSSLTMRNLVIRRSSGFH